MRSRRGKRRFFAPLTDPMFSKRALVPARVTPPALSVEELIRTPFHKMRNRRDSL